MSFAGTGFRVWGDTPDALDASLSQIAAAGFTHVEVGGGDGSDLIVAGRVNAPRLAQYVAVLDRYRDRFRYSYHGPGQANLFDLGNAGLHERLLQSGLEVASAVGAEVMVVHPGQRYPWPAGMGGPMEELRAREREILWRLAEAAGRWGGGIALETMLPAGDQNGVGYSYAVWPEQLAAQVEAVDHPALGVCLDTGHLWASARWYGFDFLAGVARLAPLVNHFHLVDNAGGAPAPSVYGDTSLGLGDQHLPPGWGDVPFADMLQGIEFPRQPVLMIEIMRERYRPDLADLRNQLWRWSAVEDEVGFAPTP